LQADRTAQFNIESDRATAERSHRTFALAIALQASSKILEKELRRRADTAAGMHAASRMMEGVPSIRTLRFDVPKVLRSDWQDFVLVGSSLTLRVFDLVNKLEQILHFIEAVGDQRRRGSDSDLADPLGSIEADLDRAARKANVIDAEITKFLISNSFVTEGSTWPYLDEATSGESAPSSTS